MILPALPIADYVADRLPGVTGPTLNSSIAHLLLTRSAAHARHAHPRLNPAWAPEEDSRFDLGTAAHAVLLEGKRNLIHIVEAPDWRSSAAKIARTLARADGKVPLLTHQATAVLALATCAEQAIHFSPDLANLGPLVAEQTLVWREPGGAFCRCRPDWMITDHAVIISFKTAANAEPEAFGRQIISLGYDVQAAFEVRAVEMLTGKVPAYVWLVAEVDPPYACSLIGLSPTMAELGRQKYDRAVKLWAACLASDTWPGYPERIAYVEPPAWAMAQWAERWGYEAPGVDDGRPLADQLLGERP